MRVAAGRVGEDKEREENAEEVMSQRMTKHISQDLSRGPF